MKNNTIRLFMSSLILGTFLTSAALAQETSNPATPRIDQIDKRLDNQQQRIETNEKNGTITPKQAARDERRDARVERQLKRDEAKHNGHITPREQRSLNHELNRNSRDIHHQHVKGEQKKLKQQQK